jgi:hypothetical protein
MRSFLSEHLAGAKELLEVRVDRLTEGLHAPDDQGPATG